MAVFFLSSVPVQNGRHFLYFYFIFVCVSARPEQTAIPFNFGFPPTTFCVLLSVGSEVPTPAVFIYCTTQSKFVVSILSLSLFWPAKFSMT